MDAYKSHEQDTIKIYEELGIFPRGCVIPNPHTKYGDDFISTINSNQHWESKLVFSRYHHWDMYHNGYDANCIAYVRADQLNRYRREDLKNPKLERTIIIDCRIVDLTHWRIERVNEVTTTVDYEIKKQWSISLTTTEQLSQLRNKCRTSTVPEEYRQEMCNDPSWDGRLVNIPTTELVTIDATPMIDSIGAARLLKAR